MFPYINLEGKNETVDLEAQEILSENNRDNKKTQQHKYEIQQHMWHKIIYNLKAESNNNGRSKKY